MFDVLATLSKLVKTQKTIEDKTQTKHVHPDQSVNKDQKVQKPVKPSKEELDQIDRLTKNAQAELALAQAKSRELILEAKDEAFTIRKNAEDEARRRLENIDRREGAIEEKERHVEKIHHETEQKYNEIEQLRKKTLERLEDISQMRKDEAKEFLLSALRDKLKETIAREIRDAEDEIREKADIKAREILVDAMKHGANDYTAEYTVSIIKIEDEDAKGRIIGKEGRNIRAFETATGVDVDLDEEGIIRLSCFDPVRREIARIALSKLLKDGRVQPGRIEEVIDQVKKDIDRVMFEEGQKLCHTVGVYNLPAPLVALLGRFKYRSSYGQNMIAHTLEETKIGVAIAQEIGADVNIVRLGCLLHDIGKVIMDKDGSHVDLGVELLEKYKIPQNVIDTVAQHHEDKQFTSPESVIVYIADAISGGRPGARYENYDEYVKRLKDLEDIAKSQKGVVEAFAFQAGREIRVMVDPGKVDDNTSKVMAFDIKEEIQNKLTYPGTVKVTVIRELRTTEVAQ